MKAGALVLGTFSIHIAIMLMDNFFAYGQPNAGPLGIFLIVEPLEDCEYLLTQMRLKPYAIIFHCYAGIRQKLIEHGKVNVVLMVGATFANGNAKRSIRFSVLN